MKKMLILLLVMLAAVSAIAAPKYGGTLVFGRSADSVSMDPAKADDGETYYATTQVFDNLVQFQYGTTKLEPGLAERWTVSPDGLTYTFYLRKGVMFHTTKFFQKSVEFTADDVVFSFERQLNQNHPFYKVGGENLYWSGMDMDNILKSVKKVDKYTVQFVLKKQEAPFLANIAMDFASIVCKQYADDLMAAGKQDQFAREPIGTGPFVFERWVKDEQIAFSANKKYWGGRPYADRLILKVITNNSVRAAELKTGQVHLMDFPNPEEIPALQKDANLKLYKQEGLNVGYLFMNMNKKPFDNINVRMAVYHAINKKAIVDAVYAGLGVPAKNPLPPTLWSYNDKITDYPYDVNKAKDYLKKAGMPNGFSTDIWAMPVARPYMPNARKVAEAIQADLAKVGIKVNIVSYDWGTYLKKLKHGEPTMGLIGWTGDNGDPDNFLYVLLSEAAAEIPAQNYAFWKNKEFNKLIEQAKVTPDQKKRSDLYKKAQEVFHKDVPWVPVAHSIVVVPASKKVEGFKIDPVGKRRFKDVYFK